MRSVRSFAAVLVLAAAAGYIPPAVDLPHIAFPSLHLMAPTCGLGRAGRAMLRLEFGRAVSFNPAIVPLVVVVVAGVVRELIGRSRQRWVTVRGRPRREWLAVWLTFSVALATWQQYRFHFLTSQRL